MSCTLILSRTEATPECTSLRSCSKDFSIWAKRSSACERTLECQRKKPNKCRVEDPITNKNPSVRSKSTHPTSLAAASSSRMRASAASFSKRAFFRAASAIKNPQKKSDIKIPSTKSHQILFFTQMFNYFFLSVYQHPYQLNHQAAKHQEIPCLQLRNLLAQLRHKPKKTGGFVLCPCPLETSRKIRCSFLKRTRLAFLIIFLKFLGFDGGVGVNFHSRWRT